MWEISTKENTKPWSKELSAYKMSLSNIPKWCYESYRITLLWQKNGLGQSVLSGTSLVPATGKIESPHATGIEALQIKCHFHTRYSFKHNNENFFCLFLYLDTEKESPRSNNFWYFQINVLSHPQPCHAISYTSLSQWLKRSLRCVCTLALTQSKSEDSEENLYTPGQNCSQELVRRSLPFVFPLPGLAVK